MSVENVSGYPVKLDLAYDPVGDLWVEVVSPSEVAIGLDSIGTESSGSLAQLSMVPPGQVIARGEPLGSLEAEKFVGPVLAPISGTVLELNTQALANPSAVHADPYGAWLVRLEPSRLSEELENLVRGTEAVREYFAGKVADYKLKGILAE